MIKFDIDPFRKHCLLNGLDNIGLTLEKHQPIDAFEEKTQTSHPWRSAIVPADCCATGGRRWRNRST